MQDDVKNGVKDVKVPRFTSNLDMNGKEARALITLKESVENGHRIYSLELQGLEPLAAKELEPSPFLHSPEPSPTGGSTATTPTSVKTYENPSIESKTLQNEAESSAKAGESGANPTKLQANAHIGAGLFGGAINGLERDEEGNISFNPQAFLQGFIGGAGASFGLKKAYENPIIKQRALSNIDNIKASYGVLARKNPVLFAKIMGKFKKNELLKGQKEVDLRAKEYFNKELQEQILKAIKLKNVSIMPKNELTRHNFASYFDAINGDIGIIHTPYRDVEVNIKYAWKHFTQNTYYKNRDGIKGAFFETFRDPLFVVEQTREGQELPSVYFYKPFYDENKKLINLFGIGLDSGGNIDFKTYYLDKKDSRLKNILNDKKIKIMYIKKL